MEIPSRSQNGVPEVPLTAHSASRVVRASGAWKVMNRGARTHQYGASAAPGRCRTETPRITAALAWGSRLATDAVKSAVGSGLCRHLLMRTRSGTRSLGAQPCLKSHLHPATPGADELFPDTARQVALGNHAALQRDVHGHLGRQACGRADLAAPRQVHQLGTGLPHERQPTRRKGRAVGEGGDRDAELGRRARGPTRAPGPP